MMIVFYATIDYIWISDGMDVDSVMKLHDLKKGGYMPNKNEGSDHVMIGAKIKIK